MSGVINRSNSTFEGAPDSPQRSFNNGRRSPFGSPKTPTPLKAFGQAKKKMQTVYTDIGSFVDDVEMFLSGVSLAHKGMLSDAILKDVEGHKERVKCIHGILERNHMKVVFFGRTSNGKSSTINAMLGERILPSGMGHTTNCFLQVEGTASKDGYILTEDSPDPKSVSSISALGSALSEVKLQEDSLIRILWPKDKCMLLKEDVVLLDSPGIDVTPDLDYVITKHCLDADVFIIVNNSESTLMQTEKNFFHKVSDRLSKPNIFMLNNRWDATASEAEDVVEKIRLQHLERNIRFLVDELKVMERKDAENRVYFVSAKEALTYRLQQKGIPPPTGALQEGFLTRCFDFEAFERAFEECISKTAIRTKFAQHLLCGREVTKVMGEVMDTVYVKSEAEKKLISAERKRLLDQITLLQNGVQQMLQDVRESIDTTARDIERQVSTAVNSELRKLSVLIEEYDRPFHPDEAVLAQYKKELHSYIERSLCMRLGMDMNDETKIHIKTSQQYMLEAVQSLLPPTAHPQLPPLVSPSSEFQLIYRLDCSNLCSDFQEDISFRFSLSVSSLAHRFFRGDKSPFMAGRRLAGGMTSSHVMRMSDTSPSDMLQMALVSFSSVTSRSTIGLIVVAALAARAAGWRVLIVSTGIYCGLYAYERASWTTRAKEREFKRQYADFATRKLRLIVDLTSSNCAHQVQQHLHSTMSRLSCVVTSQRDELQDRLVELTQRLAAVDATHTQSKSLKNRSGYIENELNSFATEFLEEGQ